MIKNEWYQAPCDAGTCVQVQWATAIACDTEACVEVGIWKASEACEAGSCVEVCGDEHDQILVRDSKNPEAGHLSFTKDEWLAFLAGAKTGEFDLS